MMREHKNYRVVIKDQVLMIDGTQGCFDYRRGRKCVRGVRMGVVTPAGFISALNDAALIPERIPGGFCLVRREQSLRIVTRIQMARSSFPLSIQVSVTNQGTKPLSIPQIRLAEISLDRLTLDQPGADIFAYIRHRIASGTGIVNLCRTRAPLFGEYRGWKIPPGQRDSWEWSSRMSWLLTALFKRGSSQGLFMAYDARRRLPARFCFEARRVRAVNDFRGELLPGQTLTTERLWLVFSDDLFETLKDYGKRLGWANPRTWRRPFIGWNSWDYYFTAIDQQDVENNLAVIRKDAFLRRKLKWIVIDDGWQQAHGDWVGNAKFCHDMADIARRIRRAGFQPGIWVAPFLVNRTSSLIRRIPQALLKGEPGGLLALDPTHPDGKRELQRIFKRLYRQGFRLFKLDFLTFFPGRDTAQGIPFHKGAYSLEMAIAEGIQTIRRAVGPKAVLLGCGDTLGSFAPIDAQRTAGDNTPFWSGILSTARSVSRQFWLNGNWWFTDMDFLLLRSKDTVIKDKEDRFLACKLSNGYAAKPYQPFDVRSGPIMNLNECQVLASLILLSGGNVFLSEKLANVNPAGWSIVRKVLTHHNGRAAVPLDFFKNPLPMLWVRRDRKGALVGVFNWTDQPRQQTIAWRRCGAANPRSIQEIWSEKKISTAPILRVTLRPRSCCVYRIVLSARQ